MTGAGSPAGSLCGPTLLGIARGAVRARLHGAPIAIPAFAWLDEPGAAFVTLRRGGRLHGCIGTIERTRPLGATVARHATLAAFEDPRSRPLSARDLDEVRIEVSVLAEPVDMPFSCEQDAIGKLEQARRGVVLSVHGRRAVFLPQVWAALPSGRDFLARLKEKAGLSAAYWHDAMELAQFSVSSFAEEGFGKDEDE